MKAALRCGTPHVAHVASSCASVTSSHCARRAVGLTTGLTSSLLELQACTRRIASATSEFRRTRDKATLLSRHSRQRSINSSEKEMTVFGTTASTGGVAAAAAVGGVAAAGSDGGECSESVVSSPAGPGCAPAPPSSRAQFLSPATLKDPTNTIHSLKEAAAAGAGAPVSSPASAGGTVGMGMASEGDVAAAAAHTTAAAIQALKDRALVLRGEIIALRDKLWKTRLNVLKVRAYLMVPLTRLCVPNCGEWMLVLTCVSQLWGVDACAYLCFLLLLSVTSPHFFSPFSFLSLPDRVS